MTAPNDLYMLVIFFYMKKNPKNLRILGLFCQDFVMIVRIFDYVKGVDTLLVVTLGISINFVQRYGKKG